MNKKQELNKKIFESNLERHLKLLGYSNYQLEFEANIYTLSFPNLPLSIYFDDYIFYPNPTFLSFYLNELKILSLWDMSEQECFINQSTKHIKSDFNKKQLEANKEKIRQLIEVDKTLSITAIAQELRITRQGLYKNQELIKLIKSLKSK